jgi:hypothetical protein
MKKVFLLVLLVMVISSVAYADTNTYKDRMGFEMAGDQLVYVNFPFIVPSGNCAQVETRRYIFSNSTSGIQASWELLTPGTTTPDHRGVYWFRNNEMACDPRFEIEGHPMDGDVYNGDWGIEVEPKDIGVLSGSKTYGNKFSLSEDDTQFSYSLMFNSFGYKVSIGKLMQVADWCDLKGVILPSQWGFLNALISWNRTMAQDAAMVEKIMINRDEIFIVICKEH